MEKKETQRLIKAMSFLAELAVYIRETNTQPEQSDIHYEEIDGISKPCVTCTAGNCIAGNYLSLFPMCQHIYIFYMTICVSFAGNYIAWTSLGDQYLLRYVSQA